MKKLEIVDNKYYIDGKEFVEKEPEVIDEIKIPEPLDRGVLLDLTNIDLVDSANRQNWQEHIIDRRLIYASQKVAKRKAKRDIATRKLEDLAERENEGWKPDWTKLSQHKYYHAYCNIYHKWITQVVDRQIPNVVYYKSEAISSKCLESKEVLAVLNELRGLQ